MVSAALIPAAPAPMTTTNIGLSGASSDCMSSKHHFAARLPDTYAPCTCDGKSGTVDSPARINDFDIGLPNCSLSLGLPPTRSCDQAPFAYGLFVHLAT